MLSSKYHFWGVHNLYQVKSANSILESKVKLVCFSFFIFRFSFFAFCFLLFDFVIHFSLLFFPFLQFVFVFIFSFFDFHFSFFDIQNWAEYHILTLDLRQNIVFSHLKFYFDIQTGAEYRILTFKNLILKFKIGGISYFEIQNPILTFKLRRNIEF